MLIVVKIYDQPVELTLAEAKKLYRQLRELFEDSNEISKLKELLPKLEPSIKFAKQFYEYIGTTYD